MLVLQPGSDDPDEVDNDDENDDEDETEPQNIQQISADTPVTKKPTPVEMKTEANKIAQYPTNVRNDENLNNQPNTNGPMQQYPPYQQYFPNYPNNPNNNQFNQIPYNGYNVPGGNPQFQYNNPNYFPYNGVPYSIISAAIGGPPYPFVPNGAPNAQYNAIPNQQMFHNNNQPTPNNNFASNSKSEPEQPSQSLTPKTRQRNQNANEQNALGKRYVSSVIDPTLSMQQNAPVTPSLTRTSNIGQNSFTQPQQNSYPQPQQQQQNGVSYNQKYSLFGQPFYDNNMNQNAMTPANAFLIPLSNNQLNSFYPFNKNFIPTVAVAPIESVSNLQTGTTNGGESTLEYVPAMSLSRSLFGRK